MMIVAPGPGTAFWFEQTQGGIGVIDVDPAYHTNYVYGNVFYNPPGSSSIQMFRYDVALEYVYPTDFQTRASNGSGPDLGAFEGISTNIVRQPLTISASSNLVLLIWPQPLAGAVLEQSAVLGATNWTSVTNPIGVVGGLNQATIPFAPVAHFFRLRYP